MSSYPPFGGAARPCMRCGAPLSVQQSQCPRCGTINPPPQGQQGSGFQQGQNSGRPMQNQGWGNQGQSFGNSGPLGSPQYGNSGDGWGAQTQNGAWSQNQSPFGGRGTQDVMVDQNP